MFQAVNQFFGKGRTIKIIATALLIFTFFVICAVLITKVDNNDFAILYSDLEFQDSAKIVQELEKRNIPYQIIHDSSIIKVYKAEVVKTRLALAQEGLPNSGSLIGYEIFDKEDSISTTNFSQNIKLVRALEGELSRTISAFEQIEKARVHLVIPQKEIFSRERIEPRASVILKFKGLRKLGKTEIDSISHLIVTSVPGLEMKRVTIVDTKGNALKIGSSDENVDFTSSKNEEIRIAAEDRLKQVIENLLENTLGIGKVKARVALTMNFDRIVTNIEQYDPDSAVVRSMQAIDEKEQAPSHEGEQADVSVANNIPAVAGGGEGGDQRLNFAITEKSDQSTNYEISKTIKNHISETGAITKMSIAVLTDGNYKYNPQTKKMDYIPRSKEELDKIKTLVKAAVGFNENRNDVVEVIDMEFFSEFVPENSENEKPERNFLNLFNIIILTVIILFILIIFVRPVIYKALNIRKNSGDAVSDIFSFKKEHLNNLPRDTDSAPPIISKQFPPKIDETENTSLNNLTQKVDNLADSNVQGMINTLRKWLNEGRQ